MLKTLITAFLLIFLSLRFPSSCSVSSFDDEQPETFIVYVSRSDKPSVYTSHHEWYSSTLQSLPPSSHPREILYTYTHAANGFAVRLAPSQASHLSNLPGIISVLPEQVHQLHTTRTPLFLGLSENALLLKNSRKGDDIIIGVLDTGIWPGHPSFNGSSLTAVPARWKGVCESGPDFPKSACNRKIIGARAYWRGHSANLEGKMGAELKSPRDTLGHGTHTASTAGGASVKNAGFYKYAAGEARGIATNARLAIYKICWSTGCAESDILAAMDQAVADGVNIISLSVGTTGLAKQYDKDSIAIGAFGAMEKGILVSVSAGNAGPGPSTAVNLAPWMLTVGASTIDRQFPGDVVMGNNVMVSGVSLYNGKSLTNTPLVFGGDSGDEFCQPGKLDSSKVSGKIVVCSSGLIGRPEKGVAVRRAGGVGMIAIETKSRGDTLSADSFLLPATTVSYESSRVILKYIQSNKNASAVINFPGTTFKTIPIVPQLAAFSSRGPNYLTPQILKPDIIAPGVNILAGWTGDVSPTGMESDIRRVKFNIISGTSMSCPHVSGLAAMLRKIYPKWTPAAIKSALMTTSYNLNKAGKSFIDEATGLSTTPLQYGSGHVEPTKALNPGLVYDITPNDYAAFLCSIGYNATQIAVFVKTGKVDCKSIGLSSPSNLNYPSFSIEFKKGKMGAVKVKRTVTNVGFATSVYNVKLSAPGTNVKITVSPRRLSFTQTNQRLSYEITLKPEITSSTKPLFGSIEWRDDYHVVRSPIVFSWGNSTSCLVASE
ncbi:hypothetical protein MKX01_006955 [Papaver californicum]|nr:hypothetical protein MKX01_006955 [Papaver californicum]